MKSKPSRLFLFDAQACCVNTFDIYPQAQKSLLLYFVAVIFTVNYQLPKMSYKNFSSARE
jgi:hypothetical protein